MSLFSVVQEYILQHMIMVIYLHDAGKIDLDLDTYLLRFFRQINLSEPLDLVFSAHFLIDIQFGRGQAFSNLVS